MREPKLYTVMVVPHSGGRMRTFAVTRAFAGTAGALLFLLVIAGMSFPHWFLSSRLQASDLEAARSRGAALARDLREVDTELARMRDQLDHYEHQARKFALLAGLESLPDELEASGGPAEDEDPGSGYDAVPDAAPAPASGPHAAIWEELDALASREQRLTRSYEALAEAWEEREAYLDSVPTITPVPGAFFGSSYGYRRDPFTGARVFHRGQDIVANTGTPILAPASGRVTRAGRTGGLGNAVYISHGRGIVSRFGHLSKVKVRAGQRVERGEVIGLVGSTGRSMGPHLHYEVLVSGKHVDPRDFILDEAGDPVS